jgi:hypothetical protein
MATRYVVNADVHLVDREGRRRFFQRSRRRNDGTFGYAPEEITGLSRDQLRRFRRVEISGMVEQATAAPGELRTLSHECEGCGRGFKSAAALGSHRRVHDEEE